MSFGSLPEYALKRCPVPRILPCEDHLSDGLNRAATLEWLAERVLPAAERRKRLPRSLTLGVSSMFTLALKRRDAQTLLVSLLALSALTNLEYCRFGILCVAGLHDALAHLRRVEATSLQALTRLCPGEELQDQLWLMLRVLMHANAVYTETSDDEPLAEAVADPAGSVRGSKRRR